MNVEPSLCANFSGATLTSGLKSNRILRLPDVLVRTGLSRSGLYERVKEGRFPAAKSLGGRSVGWLEAEVDDWICGRGCNRASYANLD